MTRKNINLLKFFLLSFFVLGMLVIIGILVAPKKTELKVAPIHHDAKTVLKMMVQKVEYGWSSWYGSDFHGNKTSSGEIYDMNAFTVASKTLPMGTVVLVENMLSDKFVVAVVNDRGPFIAGRSLDVSLRIAEKLGMMEIGICPVRISVLKLGAK